MGPEPEPKDRFHQRFLESVAVIQQQLGCLHENSPASRRAASDSILASIVALTSETQDAADSLPAHDRRSYSEALKSVSDQLRDITAELDPRTRFQFKPRAVVPLQPRADPRRAGGAIEQQLPPTTSAALPSESLSATESHDYNADIARSTDRIRRASFSTAPRIALSGHCNVHVAVPYHAAAASLTDLRRCVVQVGGSGTSGGGGLMLRNIVESVVVVVAPVEGSVHAVGLACSVLLLSARQVRLHDCSNVDIYLRCASRPVIEDCTGMRFAPLPDSVIKVKTEGADVGLGKDLWNQVEDFKWQRAEQSPNWVVIPPHERIVDSAWRDLLDLSAGSVLTVDEILEAAGVDACRPPS